MPATSNHLWNRFILLYGFSHAGDMAIGMAASLCPDWTISSHLTIGWIAMKFSRNSHDPKSMNPTDLSDADFS